MTTTNETFMWTIRMYCLKTTSTFARVRETARPVQLLLLGLQTDVLDRILNVSGEPMWLWAP